MEQLIQSQKYLLSTYLFQLSSSILNFSLVANESSVFLKLLLRENIFHPQGGGQPKDEGFVRVGDTQYAVQAIKQDREQNLVYLEITEKATELHQYLLLHKGIDVEQIVNADKRRLYARLHSAGHLLDIAVEKIGLKWLPGKGYHFEDSPYVEYIGSPDGSNLEELRRLLDEECAKLIKETGQADSRKVWSLTPIEYGEKLGSIPEYLKSVEQIRYVELCEQDKGCPCGGTHVEHIKEIGIMTIMKVQKKGKNMRVSYTIK